MPVGTSLVQVGVPSVGLRSVELAVGVTSSVQVVSTVVPLTTVWVTNVVGTGDEVVTETGLAGVDEEGPVPV